MQEWNLLFEEIKFQLTSVLMTFNLSATVIVYGRIKNN